MMLKLLQLHTRIKLFLSEKMGKSWRVPVVGLLALLVFVVPMAVHAEGGQCGLGDIGACVAMIFVKIFQLLTALMGFILIMEVDALIRVAQYFNFVSPGPTAVRIGWIVTRDLANMFFIVFLLIIAFSTVIGYAKYHYEKNLVTLLVMAVVINFSKTICGLLIDISQVLMLSFVNGFKAAAAGNFMNAFQISNLLRLGDGDQGYDSGLVLAMMLAFVLATIATCVVLVMLVMLIFRIVMLWVLIILSPIAFLTKAFPLGSNAYAEWWAEMKKYLIGGPIVAFFLWLALATAQQTNGKLSAASEGWGVQTAGSATEVQGQGDKVGINKAQIPSEAGRTDTILSMIIAICIMFAGLKQASNPSYGGLAAGFAGKVTNTAKAALRGAATYGFKRSLEPVASVGGRAFARVPLVGGLGRAAALWSEKQKKDRIGSREKLFGSTEDLARLSPGAFKRKMETLSQKDHRLDDIDKKQLDTMMGVALKNPKLAKSLGESGAGASVMSSMIRNAKDGKPLQDVLGTLMSDKSASGWARKDEELLRDAYDKTMLATFEHDKDGNMLLKDANGNIATAENGGKAVVKDPNMLKTLGELKQKFAPQFASMDQIDGNGNQILDKNGIPKKIVGETDLKEIVPRMSSDDIGGILKGDMGLFMQHMTSSQFRKVMQDGKVDQLEGAQNALAGMKEKAPDFLREKGVNATEIPNSWYANDHVAGFALAATAGNADARGKIMGDETRAAAMRKAADAGLEAAKKEKDDNKIAAAAVQAISVGSLTADKITGDLRDTIGRELDPAALKKNTDVGDTNQLGAARAAMSALMEKDATRVLNLSRNGEYSKFLPPKADIERAVAAQKAKQEQQKEVAHQDKRTELAVAAPELMEDLSGQIGALMQQVNEGRAGDGAKETLLKLNETFKKLEESNQKLAGAIAEQGKFEERIAKAKSGEAPMNPNELESLERATKSLEKTIENLQHDLAKQVAQHKGEKFGQGGGGNNRKRGA